MSTRFKDDDLGAITGFKDNLVKAYQKPIKNHHDSLFGTFCHYH